MSTYVISHEEYLAHHGIRGMKWGVRRFQNADGSLTAKGAKRYSPEKEAMKSAGKEYRKAARAAGRSDLTAVGINRIQKSASLHNTANKKEMAYIDAKAKYKMSKAKDHAKAEKAEFNAYRKEMQKSGIRGSAADTMNNNRTTNLYNHIAAKKGKEYADRVEKKVQKRAMATLVGSAIVMAGSAAASAYLSNKAYSTPMGSLNSSGSTADMYARYKRGI